MENSYLQVSNHCLICHQDCFGNHTCDAISLPCTKCDNMQKFIEQENNRYKFCPYCGHKL